MKKAKVTAIGIAALLCIAGAVYLFTAFLGNGNWPKRFDAELDQFFGEGNWETVSSESKASRMYTRTIRDSSGSSQEVAGNYKNWLIGFTDRSGEDTMCQITNHTLKINHSKHWLLSSDRYSSRQALTLELMDIAFAITEDEIWNEVVSPLLTEQESSCLNVNMSYHGGNPEPKFYDKLREEPWFTANTVTAGDFLSCDLYNFYLDISVSGPLLEKLTDEEQQHVLDSFPALQTALLDRYGSNASFALNFGGDRRVEYKDGAELES